MANEEITRPTTIVHMMEGNVTRLFLEPGIEAIHRVDIIWWIEHIKLRIEPGWSTIPGPPIHSFQMASLRSIEQDHRRIRSICPNLATNPLPPYTSMNSLNMLIWNCCGAGNNIFRRNMKELLYLHKLDILILMETKVTFSSMGNFFNNLGFSASIIIDPVGRSGGLWLIRNTDHLNVRASVVSNQYIQATVHKEDSEEWLLSVVYANPNPSARETLWEELEDTVNNISKPWLVIRDFNDFTNQSECRSFSHTHNHGRTRRFTERINNCNLIDLESVRPLLTWTNNRQGLANTMERLNRAMSNDQWRVFLTVRTLPRTYFDHSPLVVHTQGSCASDFCVNLYNDACHEMTLL
ncbi:hypothetical protein LOK49_LG15G02517 [Camellia lanceoleosa]|uniref:Uncharacterized protein n=1 Tax=Camellia lanceoleosa TaxID=1840588 RepID=A0ACC0F4V9_9ERIC|nr:hypothetical protein LOK49_LG15G02517 [Camellia lanceoleosa]